MKKIKVYNDNVLVRLETIKTMIVLPGSKDEKPQPDKKTKSVTVITMGTAAKNGLSECRINEGDIVLLGNNPLQTHHPYNSALGAKENAEDPGCSVFYYFVKSFDIIAKAE